MITEAIPWELKQIFDKTVQLKQINICELNGLMVLLIDKGRICIFKLSEFSQIMSDSNWDQNQTKSKQHCKERKLEFVNGCQIYAMSKNLINKTDQVKIIAACGKKLLVIYSKSSSCSTNICSSCIASMNTAPANTLTVNSNLSSSGFPSSISNSNLGSSDSEENIVNSFYLRKVIRWILDLFMKINL